MAHSSKIPSRSAGSGWQNMIVRTRAAEVYNPEHVGPLSIKCAFGGNEIYEVEGGRFAVDDDRFLILNGGQRYASHVRAAAEVESFCIFFRPELVDEVLNVLVTPADRLLYDPSRVYVQPVTFFAKLYEHGPGLSGSIQRLRAALDGTGLSRGWFDDQFPLLLERMLEVHRDVRAQMERVPSVRSSTKAELFARLSRARDFMDASLDSAIDLPAIAAVACLSPYHFLRLFRDLFGETPHRYLTRRRLEHACRLLAATDLSVTEICERVGFESLGSFSWLFKRRIGSSPEAYRTGRRGS